MRNARSVKVEVRIATAYHQYARGNLSARIPVRRDDELGELARIINLSADQLRRISIAPPPADSRLAPPPSMGRGFQ